MTLIPAKEQGLPMNRFDPLDRIVPRSRAPADADSTTLEPYIPTEADAALQRRDQPGIGYTPDAADAERRKAVAEYEKSK
jgi:hypothetical protein